MKKYLLMLLLASGLTAKAQQDDCNFTVVTTDNGETKSTPEYLMHEKVFNGTSSFVFFSMTLHDDIPVLNFQLLAKSDDFPKAYCFTKKSRIHLQLTNGKVVTLFCIDEDACSQLLYDEAEKKNLRMLNGHFLFTKGSIEDLEASPILFMRVLYSAETVDYPLRSNLESETMGKNYKPDSYFIQYLKCIK